MHLFSCIEDITFKGVGGNNLQGLQKVDGCGRDVVNYLFYQKL